MTTSIYDDNDASWAGMTLAGIYRKHRRLRGSDDLRYPPTRRERCQSVCHAEDMREGGVENLRVSDHQCFLAPHLPSQPHEFSSECDAMHVEAAL